MTLFSGHILRGDEFDTLLELSARHVIKHNIAFRHLDIPPRLAWMMAHPRNCALCGVPIVQCFTEYVRFDIVCSYHRVPLLFRVCTRPHKEFVFEQTAVIKSSRYCFTEPLASTDSLG